MVLINNTLPELPQSSWSNEQLGDYCRMMNGKLAIFAHRIGTALLIVKTRLERGEWQLWLQTYCPEMSDETARRYRKVALEFSEAELEGMQLIQAYRILGFASSKKESKSESQSEAVDHSFSDGKRESSSPIQQSPQNENSESPSQNGEKQAIQEPGETELTIEIPDPHLSPEEALRDDILKTLPDRIQFLRDTIRCVLGKPLELRQHCWADLGESTNKILKELTVDVKLLEKDIRAALTKRKRKIRSHTALCEN